MSRLDDQALEAAIRVGARAILLVQRNTRGVRLCLAHEGRSRQKLALIEWAVMRRYDSMEAWDQSPFAPIIWPPSMVVLEDLPGEGERGTLQWGTAGYRYWSPSVFPRRQT